MRDWLRQEKDMHEIINKRVVRFFLILSAIITIAGCSSRENRFGGTVSVVTPDFFGIGEDITVQLESNLRQPLGKGRRLIVATMVNLDDLYQTSSFGRALTEAISTRLFQRGFGVVEIRKSSEILMKDTSGELVLTRDVTLLSGEEETEGIVVGTYTLTPNSVLVNVKMLEATGREVLSAAGIEIQRTANINFLLSRNAGGKNMTMSAYER